MNKALALSKYILNPFTQLYRGGGHYTSLGWPSGNNQRLISLEQSTITREWTKVVEKIVVCEVVLRQYYPCLWGCMSLWICLEFLVFCIIRLKRLIQSFLMGLCSPLVFMPILMILLFVSPTLCYVASTHIYPGFYCRVKNSLKFTISRWISIPARSLIMWQQTIIGGISRDKLQ